MFKILLKSCGAECIIVVYEFLIGAGQVCPAVIPGMPVEKERAYA